MPTIGRFRDVLALWHAGVLLSEDVPSVVSSLGDVAVSSAALVELSGLRNPVASEIEPLLTRATRELSEVPPSPAACAWRSAYIVAGWISAAEVSPRIGAQHLDRLCIALDVPDALTSFIYFDSDYGLGPGPRETDEAWFDEQIRKEAQRLLSPQPEDAEGSPLSAAYRRLPSTRAASVAVVGPRPHLQEPIGTVVH